MPEIAEVIRQLREDDSVYAEVNDAGTRFLTSRGEVYLGAQFLPARTQDNNYYSSDSVVFLDIIADDADRYSPPRFKGSGARVSGMEVALGDMNIADQLWERDYDTLVRLIPDNSDRAMLEAAGVLLDFSGRLGRGMSSKGEKQIWQALVDGQVVREINGTRSLVQYPTETGQRANLLNAWSDSAHDPMDDFQNVEDYGADMGYNALSRIVTSTFGMRTLQRNPNMKVNIYGEDSGNRRVSQADINSFLADEGYPQIETYDGRWHDVGGTSGRYFPEDAIMFAFDTGASPEELAALAEENSRVALPASALSGGTIGHNGIGTCAGEPRPGTVVDLYEGLGRPKRVIGEGQQTSLPVLDHPYAFAIRRNIR